MDFYMPTKLITGRDAVRDNAALLASFGKRCLIVTGATAAKRSGALDDATAALAQNGIAYTVFDRILPNPTMASCIEAGRMGVDFEADFVLGIGGGSPLDAAKVVAVSIANPSLTEPELFSLAWPNKPVPIVLIGTTSGTGSEVTQVSVITNENGNKVGVRSDDLYAALAFGDPRYTESMPLSVTATTGVDALCHCIESYLNNAANDICRALAVQGIRMLLPLLNKVADGNLPTLFERETLYNASIIGGLAISIDGTVAPHAIGYLLTEQYNVPHGFACAAFLPALFEHVARFEPALAEEFFTRIGATRAELVALTQRLLPKFAFRLTDEQIRALAPRWPLSLRNIFKTPGTCDQAAVEAFLKSVFQA